MKVNVDLCVTFFSLKMSYVFLYTSFVREYTHKIHQCFSGGKVRKLRLMYRTFLLNPPPCPPRRVFVKPEKSVFEMRWSRQFINLHASLYKQLFMLFDLLHAHRSFYAIMNFSPVMGSSFSANHLELKVKTKFTKLGYLALWIAIK